MQEEDRLFLATASPCLHSLREKDSWLRVEILHIQTAEEGHSIGRVYHHRSGHASQHSATCMRVVEGKPTLIGASSSNKIGCAIKISLALVHK